MALYIFIYIFSIHFRACICNEIWIIQWIFCDFISALPRRNSITVKNGAKQWTQNTWTEQKYIICNRSSFKFESIILVCQVALFLSHFWCESNLCSKWMASANWHGFKYIRRWRRYSKMTSWTCECGTRIDVATTLNDVFVCGIGRVFDQCDQSNSRHRRRKCTASAWLACIHVKNPWMCDAELEIVECVESIKRWLSSCKRDHKLQVDCKDLANTWLNFRIDGSHRSAKYGLYAWWQWRWAWTLR